jgi:hypothetical protein
MELIEDSTHRGPWNKGKLTRKKVPLKLKEIWAIRVRLSWKSRLLHCLWHIPFAMGREWSTTSEPSDPDKGR